MNSLKSKFAVQQTGEPQRNRCQ